MNFFADLVCGCMNVILRGFDIFKSWEMNTIVYNTINNVDNLTLLSYNEIKVTKSYYLITNVIKQNFPLIIMEIKKVLQREMDQMKYVIVPKNSNIKKGDYVKIEKIKNQEEEQS